MHLLNIGNTIYQQNYLNLHIYSSIFSEWLNFEVLGFKSMLCGKPLFDNYIQCIALLTVSIVFKLKPTLYSYISAD